MRPTAWVSFLAVFLLTAAVCKGFSPAQAPPAKASAARHLPSWVVEGYSTASAEEAVQDALDKAPAKVNEYLRSQTPPMEWSIDRGYLQQKLWVNLDGNDPTFKALGWKDSQQATVSGHVVQVDRQALKGNEPAHHVAICVKVSDFARKEFDQQEQTTQAKLRQERATSRQGVLARVLGGLVAVLAVIACYLRLEDATKGYYTTLLRLAAVAFVALVGAGIWLFS
jgi:hypothetical protein